MNRNRHRVVMSAARHMLSVTGLCHCTGFRDWTVAPLACLVDGSGNVISTLDA